MDGYNLYYGARGLCGRGTPGWRWLDIRALATSLVAARTNWQGSTIHRVVYCTALIDAATNPSGYTDQDIYLKALSSAAILIVVLLRHTPPGSLAEPGFLFRSFGAGKDLRFRRKQKINC
ncbi:hypothetical protein [Actinoplanes rectilineatus]|uniref:hypothetical protein n=1 Tax=Actinoplanes rectilineatus TaxID=113571 RepID=UPI001B800B6A|nr:hypothetical protein [Actinoplanes rectilineatus]